MSIDNNEKVLDFWKARALKNTSKKVKNSANLEDDPELSKLKINLENKKVTQYIMKTDLSGHALDLGSGFGYWSLEIGESTLEIGYSRLRLEIGDWRVQSAEWRVESGECRVER